ncbi:MAG: hypothetical protein ACTHLY_00880 [Pseudolabrys sp.]
MSDNEADDRLKAALAALGTAPGATPSADAVLKSARKALTMLSLGLIAANERQNSEA